MTFDEWWSENGVPSLGLKPMSRYTFSAATELERDACAAECDALGKEYIQEVSKKYLTGMALTMMAIATEKCAVAIRNRENKE